MPLLFYGSTRPDRARQLYSKDLRLIETSIFDSYKIKDLAPYEELPGKYGTSWALSLLWHFPIKKHTAIAWHAESCKHEQVIWIPGLLNQIDALTIAREEFPSIVPSAIIFRFVNEGDPYEYI